MKDTMVSQDIMTQNTDIIPNDEETHQQEFDSFKVTIDPKKAKQILKFNTANRPLNSRTIDRYANDMKAGKWCFNGEAIKVAKSGKLLDGQHRLHAVIKSETPIDVLMAVGIDDEAFDTLDIGKKRSLSDTLAVAGYKYWVEKSAMIRDFYFWKIYKYSYKCKRTYHLSNKEGYNFYVKEKDIIDFTLDKCLPYKLGQRKLPIPFSKLCLAYAVLYRIDQEDADLFVDQLVHGYNLDKESPILALRNLLISRDRLELKERIDADYFIMDIVFKCWNDFRNRIRVQEYKFRKNLKKITYPLGYRD